MSPKDSLIKYRQGVINKNHVEAYAFRLLSFQYMLKPFERLTDLDQ